MYSHIVDDKVLDFRYVKTATAGMYQFYIGDIRLGSVHSICRRWTAVTVRGKMDGFCGRVDGFGSRTDAALYLVNFFDNERGIERD